jgi:cation transport ATPase
LRRGARHRGAASDVAKACTEAILSNQRTSRLVRSPRHPLDRLDQFLNLVSLLDADGTDKEIALDHVQVGDRLRIRLGDGVPVDGLVLEGRSSVDEPLVTGESAACIQGAEL